MSTAAATTHDADMMCCGTQAAWNSQPANPSAGSITASMRLAPKIHSSTVRADAEADSTTARIAALRPPSQAARPIIMASEAAAANQVMAASASQPLMPVAAASSAALKCQR